MKLKRFFAKSGRKFSGAFEIFDNVFDELLRRILYVHEFFFGWLLRSFFKKKIHLRILILTREDGHRTSTIAQVEKSVEHAKKVLKAGANIVFEKSEVRYILENAPSYALRVEAGISNTGDIFGAAGAFFRSHTSPGELTVFVIDDVIGAKAFSPFVTNYVFVDTEGIKKQSVLVHQIGHACGLLHWYWQDNFMITPTSISNDKVTLWQANILRSSRHVHYT